MLKLVVRLTAAVACAAVWLIGCANQNVGALSTSQNAPDQWIYIAQWPASVGPDQMEHDELWVGLSGREIRWRRLNERQVVAVEDSPKLSTEATSRMLSATLGEPPVSRGLGERSPSLDARTGPYLRVAIGTGEAFSEWADEERFLQSAIVLAAHDLMRSARPATARLPAEPKAWVQALPIYGSLVTLLDSRRQIRTMTPDTMGDDPLAKALRKPFAWESVDLAKSPVVGTLVLTVQNPVVIVRVRDQVFELSLQTR